MNQFQTFKPFNRFAPFKTSSALKEFSLAHSEGEGRGEG